MQSESLASPDTEDVVPFQPGTKRGKVWVPTFSPDEEAQQRKQAATAEAVRLEPDEEAALAAASLQDVMALADILNTNPQNFIMEAYADPLKYFEPDPPNATRHHIIHQWHRWTDTCLKPSLIECKYTCDFHSLYSLVSCSRRC